MKRQKKKENKDLCILLKCKFYLKKDGSKEEKGKKNEK